MVQVKQHNVGDLRTLGNFEEEYTLAQTDYEVHSILESAGLADESQFYDMKHSFPYLMVKTGNAEFMEIWGVNSVTLDSSIELLWSKRDQDIRFELSHTFHAIGDLTKSARYPKQAATFIDRVYSWILATTPNLSVSAVATMAVIAAFNFRWINVNALDWNGIERDNFYLER